VKPAKELKKGKKPYIFICSVLTDTSLSSGPMPLPHQHLTQNMLLGDSEITLLDWVYVAQGVQAYMHP
jgi:hypothetical protein